MKKFFGGIWTTIKGGTHRVITFTAKHKIIAGIIVIAIVGGGYWGYTAFAAGNAGTEYVLSAATKGPLQVTVTGSGQVAANDQLALTPQASGQVTEVDVTAGQTVKAGQVIARIDDTTANEAVVSARSDLESANISYQQTLTSSQISLSGDETSVSTDITSTYTDLPTVMNGFNGILYNLSTIEDYTAEENLDAYANFIKSDVSASDYQQSLSLYNSTNGTTLTTAQSEQLAQSTIATLTSINTALTDTLSFYNYINDQVTSGHLTVPSQLTTQISSLTTYQATVTSDKTDLTNDLNSLESDSQTLAQSNSSTPLDIQTAELNVQKAQESLDEAEQNESDYVVTAPFDGTIASVAAKQYDQASSGTTIATLITPDEYADLSLNEADVAKVQVGQAVSLTFDALPNVTMAGTVASVSDIGTVTSGVVTYDVKIGFNTVNNDIKPGMTVDATIITASEPMAIQVPAAAIHTTGNYSYVEVATLKNASSTATTASGVTGTGGFTGTRRTRTASSAGTYAGFGAGATGSSTSGGFGGGFASSTGSTSVAITTPMVTRSTTVPASDVTIKNVPVTVGLANDTMTEITSGITAGQLVVTATQSNTVTATKTTAASATSLLGGSTRTTGASATGRSTGGYTGGGGGFTGGGAPGGGG
jgi:HlyD family secretion protein